jgi:hypothetical protein
MLNQLDMPRFTTAEAAVACGMKSTALGVRLHRGDVKQPPDVTDEAWKPGTGRSRMLSERRVLHLVLTQELARIGLDVALASNLALQFTDVGGAGQDAAVLVDQHLPPVRLAGALIEGRRTLFRVLYPMDGGEPVARVDAADAVSAAPLMADHLPCLAGVIVDMDALVARTRQRLGLAAQP